MKDSRPSGQREELRINEEITAAKVRLIDAEGQNQGIVLIARAQTAALEGDLDLVEISPDSDPPVCRLLDYGKFKYQAQKRASEAKRKQKTIDIKELKMRPTIDAHDYAIKLRKSQDFLSHGDKVKITLRFRGREMAHPELGAKLMERVREELDETARVEVEPKMEGRQMVMVLTPKQTGGNKSA